MKITQKALPKSVVELTITVEQKEIDAASKAIFDQLTSQLKLSGFRKGKIPEDIARQHISEAEVRGHMVETYIPKWYIAALKEKQLRVISDPEFDLEKLEDDKPITFKATITVYPEFKLGEYDKVRVKPKEVKITDKDMDDTLQILRRQHAHYEPADKKADKEDIIVVNTQAQLDGQELKAFTRDDYQHLIGEGFFAPGFDEKVTGLKKGDIEKFSLTMPDSYPLEKYRGRSIDLVVTVKEVRSQILPKADDDFAKHFGATNLEDLKNKLKEQLRMNALNEAAREFQNSVLEKVSKTTKIEVPEILIEDEVEHIQRELEWRLKQQGFTLDMFLKSQNKKLEDLQPEWKERGEKIAKLGLILDAIAREQKIEIKEEELASEMSTWLNSYRDAKGKVTPEGNKLRQNLESANGRIYLTQLLRREKTKQYLYDMANPKEEPKTKDKKDESADNS